VRHAGWVTAVQGGGVQPLRDSSAWSAAQLALLSALPVSALNPLSVLVSHGPVLACALGWSFCQRDASLMSSQRGTGCPACSERCAAIQLGATCGALLVRNAASGNDPLPGPPLSAQCGVLPFLSAPVLAPSWTSSSVAPHGSCVWLSQQWVAMLQYTAPAAGAALHRAHSGVCRVCTGGCAVRSLKHHVVCTV
jgi:hypothetical protein